MHPVLIHVAYSFLQMWPTASWGLAYGWDVNAGQATVTIAGQTTPNSKAFTGQWFTEGHTNQSIWQWDFHNSSVSPTRCTGSYDPIWYGWVGRNGFFGIPYANPPHLLISTVLVDNSGLWVYAMEGQPGEDLKPQILSFNRYDENRDGMLTPQELFNFIDDYTTNRNRADLNRDGTISIQDLFDFLKAMQG